MCSVCKSLLASHGKSGCCRPRRRRVGQRWGNLKLGVERLHVEAELLVSIVNNKLENNDHGGTTLHTFGILRKSAHNLPDWSNDTSGKLRHDIRPQSYINRLS